MACTRQAAMPRCKYKWPNPSFLYKVVPKCNLEMKQPNHDMPKEFVYDNNSRNPTFLIDIETSDGLCESHEKFWMEKTGIANCF